MIQTDDEEEYGRTGGEEDLELEPWKTLETSPESRKGDGRGESSGHCWASRRNRSAQWLLAHEAEIPEPLVTEMVRVCRRERSRELLPRGTGADTILGGPLLAGGTAGFLVCVLRIDAGAGTLEFGGAVASVFPAVVGLLLVLRGLDRVVFGARAEGEAKDTILWE